MDFSGTEVSYHQMRSLLSESSVLRHGRLHSLSFSSSSLIDRSTIILSNGLSSFSRLARLDLSYNNDLTPASLLVLGEAVASMRSIEELSLAGISCLGWAARCQGLFMSLQNHPTLERLNLANINLSDTNVHVIGRLLACPSSSLEAVILDDNRVLGDPVALYQLFTFLPCRQDCLAFLEHGRFASTPAQPWVPAVSLRQIPFQLTALKLLLECLLVARTQTLFLSLDQADPTERPSSEVVRVTGERLALFLADERCALRSLLLEGDLISTDVLQSIANVLKRQPAGHLRNLLFENCPSLELGDGTSSIKDLLAAQHRLALVSLPPELVTNFTDDLFARDSPLSLRLPLCARLRLNQMAYCVRVVSLAMLCWKVVQTYDLIDCVQPPKPRDRKRNRSAEQAPQSQSFKYQRS